ncbi:type II secretion system protein F [Thermotoga maritima MSB8]|uniref:General secretion pathway protein F, putative n=1 Tax=Thermotoga maritima (strain ATCC 43589 / DSM 3109 / JCM 10099 / NBRC 100826 / MSB8) TaxID=243274 RepID=Q9WXU9_THEMA|nr:type II secretion system F family protein [Thermotoga maritima]AAD35188.1 general secretion pathway protein F, putative [Thermotoga maritima MSB8]AGL49017.1 Type II secretory pathway, component PulF / Type IV fimbrial assembly protein PilC [Thermotoga maritima MSB8]AHD18137.1 type II secretion system protein F [Thermotoga maritima MSB8]AKE26039.1 type II secretion system protein F [Thermotoga maritima]AKE27901.1 type II secretion system protein F [Thermotoga maritima MSB8]
MPFYKYVAVEGSGKKITGVIEAENKLKAISILSERGLMVVRVEERKKAQRSSTFFQISISEIATFCRQLSIMISAGIRIKEALNILARQTVFSRRFRKVILEIALNVETGDSLAEAFRKTGVFDNVLISMLEAGEEGGVLDRTLKRAADFYESIKRLQDEVKSAMAYPLFVLFFAVVIVLVISFYILPNLVRAFGTSIPLSPTIRSLLKANEFLSENWPWFSVLVTGIIAGIFVLMKSKYGVYIKEYLSFIFPPVRKLRQNMGLERFARTLGILVGSGVRITDAIKMAAQASSSPSIIRKTEEMVRKISEGKTLRDTFAESGVFPQLIYEMIGTGEETGKVDEVMERVADFYEDIVKNSVKQLVSLVEPLLIAGVGGFVAFLAYSIYTTVFQLQRSIGG